MMEVGASNKSTEVVFPFLLVMNTNEIGNLDSLEGLVSTVSSYVQVLTDKFLFNREKKLYDEELVIDSVTSQATESCGLHSLDFYKESFPLDAVICVIMESRISLFHSPRINSHALEASLLQELKSFTNRGTKDIHVSYLGPNVYSTHLRMRFHGTDLSNFALDPHLQSYLESSLSAFFRLNSAFETGVIDVAVQLWGYQINSPLRGTSLSSWEGDGTTSPSIAASTLLTDNADTLEISITLYIETLAVLRKSLSQVAQEGIRDGSDILMQELRRLDRNENGENIFEQLLSVEVLPDWLQPSDSPSASSLSPTVSHSVRGASPKVSDNYSVTTYLVDDSPLRLLSMDTLKVVLVTLPCVIFSLGIMFILWKRQRSLKREECPPQEK